MKSLAFAASFFTTVLACTLPVMQPAQAGTAIQKCAASDGGTVYTDTACGAFGAIATPIPGALLNRIAHDEASNPGMESIANSDAVATTAIAVGRRSAADGCARSPTQLSMDLQGSFAMGDVNRLAESYHWVGMTQKQAQPIMQRLDRLSHQPLVDVHFFDASIGPAGMQMADAGPARGNGSSGVMQIVLGGTSQQVLDFDVERYAGCYFIRF